MQQIIKFEVFGQTISMNSNLPGAYIFRSALGLYDNLYTEEAEALVGVCSIEQFGC